MDITPQVTTDTITIAVYAHPDDPALTATVTDGQVVIAYSDIEGQWSATLPTSIADQASDLLLAVSAADSQSET